MNSFEKIRIVFDYIIISCVKNWNFYKHIITKVEKREITSNNPTLDRKEVRLEAELMVKKLVVFLPFKTTCIQRSLTIYRFLARKGIVTDFMVGVRVAPYAFHCWLTYKGEVVFDSPAESRYYQMKVIKINEYFGLFSFHNHKK